VTSGIRVLHVDDDDAFRDLTQRYLEREGIDVVDAERAADALDRLDESVDCVVSDYDMPNTDGLELLESVRERDSDLPYILFTGKGSEEIASDAISAGVTDYLQKDASAEQFTVLSNRIEHAVTKRRTKAALEESERMLSTLVSNLPGIVYRCRNEPEWPMEYMSGNVAELTGYDAETFLKGDLKWADILRDDEERLWNTVQSALDDREPFETTYRIADADGETRWMWEQGRGVFEDGELVALEGFITEVTERKRHEQELAKYERLVDAMGDPVYTTDADGYVTTFNKRATALTGYEADDIVGEHVEMLLTPEDIERGRAVVRELLDSEGADTATYDITIRAADGEHLELENHVALLADGSEFRGTVGVLRSSEDRTDNRLRRLHESARELMSEGDRDRIASLTTDAAKEILGQPITTVRLEADGALLVASTTEEAEETLPERPRDVSGDTPAGAAFREGEPRVEDDLSEYDDFDRGSVSSAAYFPLGDHGVLIIGAIQSDAFDARDIQLATILAANAEAALDRAAKEEALRQERDDLQALFENIPDPTVETVIRRGEAVVERANPAFEDVFGYDEAAVTGENLDEFIVPTESRNEAVQYNERIREGEGFHGEVRRLTDDGLRDFILHVVPHDVTGESTRGYAIYTDITEQKQRERELARQNERLDQFASVVSHDLRNPLSVARGRVELARMTGDEKHFEALERAHDRMEELIEGLLALARQGELTGDPVAVELESAAEAAWETTDTDDLTLELDETTTLEADPERLRQLLENLFRNAVEHGEEVSTLAVGSLPDGFYVEDDGVGIPDDERESVLESGYSTAGGTGFGLAIVDTIAEAHGWEVSVTESDSGGARFEFRGATAE
jgi:PAS domain S-box-containing protein